MGACAHPGWHHGVVRASEASPSARVYAVEGIHTLGVRSTPPAGWHACLRVAGGGRPERAPPRANMRHSDLVHVLAATGER
eukprot:6874486-Prymnesium_polylepis.1